MRTQISGGVGTLGPNAEGLKQVGALILVFLTSHILRITGLIPEGFLKSWLLDVPASSSAIALHCTTVARKFLWAIRVMLRVKR